MFRITLPNWTTNVRWIYVAYSHWKELFCSSYFSVLPRTECYYILFLFLQVWQRLPWQRLWSYRKWNLWQWIACMEVEVKMEQNRKMKSSTLTRVSNTVHLSCRGAMNTWVCAWDTKSKICLKILCSFFCVSFALPVLNQNYRTHSSNIPPVFLLTTTFISFICNILLKDSFIMLEYRHFKLFTKYLFSNKRLLYWQ